MKKLYLSTLALSLSLFSFISEAETFEADGLNYNITGDNTCEVAEGAYDGDIVIPETVINDGKEFTVTGIGERAFELTSVTTVEIPETVTTIGDWAFLDCSDLVEINIPNSVTYLGFYALGCCYALETATLSTSITVIDEELFRDCSSLTSIIIPEGVTEIKEDAFYGCSALENVQLPSTLRVLGEYVFAECSSLKYIELPEGLTSLGYSLFQRAALTGCKLPSTLEKIDACAFYQCSGMTEIELPASLRTIGGSAFYGCSKLMKITSLPTVPPIIEKESSFAQSTYDNARVIVQADAVESYSGDDMWSKFASIESLSTSGINDAVCNSANDAKLYDLRGVETDRASHKGIYIKNNKKYLAR